MPQRHEPIAPRGIHSQAAKLEDVFWMSQLCWPVPDRCIRLPIDMKLCDDVLRSVAAPADDDEAIYGEDLPEGEEANVPVSHARQEGGLKDERHDRTFA